MGKLKTVVFFHDELIYRVNKDQPSFWGIRVLVYWSHRAKELVIWIPILWIRGRVSWGWHTNSKKSKVADPTIWVLARELLEYGEGKERYWTSEKFMRQMEQAIKIADVKYPRTRDGGVFGYLTTAFVLFPVYGCLRILNCRYFVRFSLQQWSRPLQRRVFRDPTKGHRGSKLLTLTPGFGTYCTHLSLHTQSHMASPWHLAPKDDTYFAHGLFWEGFALGSPVGCP